MDRTIHTVFQSLKVDWRNQQLGNADGGALALMAGLPAGSKSDNSGIGSDRANVGSGGQCAVPIAKVKKDEVRRKGVQNLSQLESLRIPVQSLLEKYLVRFLSQALDGCVTGIVVNQKYGPEHRVSSRGMAYSPDIDKRWNIL